MAFLENSLIILVSFSELVKFINISRVKVEKRPGWPGG